MRLKALRPLTAMTSLSTPTGPSPSHAALQPSLVAPRFAYSDVRRPPDDDDVVTPPPAGRPPRPEGSIAPLPPPPQRPHRHRRQAPRPNIVNPTGQVLKVLGGVTALVGAYHAAPAVHEQWHKHRHRGPARRDDIVIELPETGAVHPDMGRRPA